jgi:hypothetical protein
MSVAWLASYKKAMDTLSSPVLSLSQGLVATRTHEAPRNVRLTYVSYYSTNSLGAALARAMKNIFQNSGNRIPERRLTGSFVTSGPQRPR